ncbi:hypothetical protein JZ751_009196 [Albula glossodonta]|uniref:Uncharacterized protein n=1 Tax=Albula glossodonta TaxID=121402 RepID=A0A8T2MLS4_9TELE|nr:hypothetical protein JZ751_009196 [Albula glossodonta]
MSGVTLAPPDDPPTQVLGPTHTNNQDTGSQPLLAGPVSRGRTPGRGTSPHPHRNPNHANKVTLCYTHSTQPAHTAQASPLLVTQGEVTHAGREVHTLTRIHTNETKEAGPPPRPKIKNKTNENPAETAVPPASRNRRDRTLVDSQSYKSTGPGTGKAREGGAKHQPGVAASPPSPSPSSSAGYWVGRRHGSRRAVPASSSLTLTLKRNPPLPEPRLPRPPLSYPDSLRGGNERQLRQITNQAKQGRQPTLIHIPHACPKLPMKKNSPKQRHVRLTS